MKYSRCDNANQMCADSLTMITNKTTNTGTPATVGTTTTDSGMKIMQKTMSPATSSGFLSDSSPTPPGTSASNYSISGNSGTMLFSDEFRTVENLFEKWSDCERTVVMYALLKRLRYPCLKFLQYSIDNNLTQHAVAQSTMNAVIADINANNPSYLQNLLNAYNNLHLNDCILSASASAPLSSSSSSSCASDKDPMPCYGTAVAADERKIYAKKEDILNEILNILPLLKPGNEDAKTIYLSLIPNAVNDTIKQIVPAEVVQQIFSYLLIHPAVTSDDRRSLNVWLRQLEDFLHNSQRIANAFFAPASKSDFHNSNSLLSGDSLIMNSVCSATSSSSCSSSSASSSATSCNSVNNANISICGGGGGVGISCNNSFAAANLSRNSDWQTIAPPSKIKQQQQQQPKIPQLSDWCDALARRRQSSGAIPTSMAAADHQLCDNFNGITLNELSSSQSNSLGLGSLVEDSPAVNAVVVGVGATVVDGGSVNESSLVNGVAAAAASAESALFSASSVNQVAGPQSNPIINIINSNTNCCESLIGDDHDTSFSKNGTDFDFEPTMPSNASNSLANPLNQFSASKDSFSCSPQPFASLFMHNHTDQLMDTANRWSLDSKIAALKTRRSNSLTTQTISTSSTSSSNSSVITVNDNCSNSTEDLAQFANKPRSFSLSIENQQRGVLLNGSSDTRLDDFKPNYIKFQTRNVGMSSIGAWLKSLRLHKYIELFHNMTYEDMLQITEEYLQNVGVTKGASHKLAICIEKLKERTKVLIKLEQDLLSGKVVMHKAVEDLTNIVLTPMKPVEAVNATLGEDNVALMFLRVVDLVCSIVQRDPYSLPEDDNLSSIIWILDRAIHCEAFVNHINQLKDLKFQISKLKIAFAPRLHYSKNGGANGGGGTGAAMNKARWNGKPRKCDSKNGSNDRINYRKNSGDIMNLPVGGGLQQQQQQQQNSACGVDNYQMKPNNNNNTVSNSSQYKNATYPNYTQQQQVQTNVQQQQQQQQQSNGRSLSNLIVVAGGPQLPQKVVFKNGGHQQQQQQGILSMTHSIRSSADDLQMLDGNVVAATAAATGTTATNNHNQPKKTMAAVVMVSNNSQFASIDSLLQQDSFNNVTNPAAAAAAIQQQQTIETHNNNVDDNIVVARNVNDDVDENNVLISQEQLQLLAAAAAAVAAAAAGNLNNTDSHNHNSIRSNSSNELTTTCCSGNQTLNQETKMLLRHQPSQQTLSSTSTCATTHIINQHFLNEHSILNEIADEIAAINNSNNNNNNSNNNNNKINNNSCNTNINDMCSLEQLETLCLQMTEQAIN